MPSCAIKNCKNTSTKKRKLSFFSFPKAPEMIEKWRAVCKENVNPKNGRVCSEHFHSSQYEDRNWLKDLVGVNGNVRIRLKSDAVPEITNDNTEIEIDTIASDTFASDTIAPSLSCTQENLSSVASGVSNPVTAINSEDTCKKTSTNQDHDKEIQTMKEKNAELLKEVQSLKRQLALRDKRHKKELEQRLTLQSKLHKKKLEQKFREMLTPFFTPGQIQLILHPTQSRTRWSSEDIASAISLKSVSPGLTFLIVHANMDIMRD
ncbi:hypothetical protein ALC62_05554 [Cyphomyrmex costatus]|uniref:THAP-type domain-containing protein n=1 Tax=Cyphomyrmex costatus TaxID=456900 RepID=A0A151IJJ6_9HYME|nr:hypothetical protein ALC62_05554 [Cyphomyrmex costatus]